MCCNHHGHHRGTCKHRGSANPTVHGQVNLAERNEAATSIGDKSKQLRTPFRYSQHAANNATTSPTVHKGALKAPLTFGACRAEIGMVTSCSIQAVKHVTSAGQTARTTNAGIQCAHSLVLIDTDRDSTANGQNKLCKEAVPYQSPCRR